MADINTAITTSRSVPAVLLFDSHLLEKSLFAVGMEVMKPIGQILREQRRSAGASTSTDTSQKKNVISLEDQIRLLEEQLDAKDDDSSDSDSARDLESDDEGSVSDNMIYEKDDNGNIIRIVSKICSEAIQPLAESQLPQPMCSKGSKQKASFKLLKSLKPLEKEKTKTLVRFADDTNDERETHDTLTSVEKTEEEREADLVREQEEKARRQERKEKKKRPRNEEEREKKEGEEIKKERISGLEKTVKELLLNYIPASLEKKAFYCRICREESVDIESFEAHKKSELHQVAIKMEKKMSFCVMCRKQFTSPNQLKEHLSGKQHKGNLAYMKEKQLKQKEMKKFR